MKNELEKGMEALKAQLLLLGTEVEQNLIKASRAFAAADPVLAAGIKEHDREIDRLEITVEEECLRLMALYQPVAGDLRFLVTVLKINNDLERIGDLAAKIADKVILISREPAGGQDRVREAARWLDAMFSRTISMVHDSLDAFVDEDSDLAYRICLEDDVVDREKGAIRSEIEAVLADNPGDHRFLAKLLGVSRCLERIADHATNICEDIIYMLQGRIVRHSLDILEREEEQAPDDSNPA
jgi:phosphate transport system protein